MGTLTISVSIAFPGGFRKFDQGMIYQAVSRHEDENLKINLASSSCLGILYIVSQILLSIDDENWSGKINKMCFKIKIKILKMFTCTCNYFVFPYIFIPQPSEMSPEKIKETTIWVWSKKVANCTSSGENTKERYAYTTLFKS